MGYVDVAGVGHTLPDGRVLFADVSFRVGEGAKIALIGPNGAGKTTLLRMVAGDIPVQSGVAALDLPWEKVRDRPVATLSGGQQKRFALELLLRGSDEVLLLDEPDNFLDVPAKRWLEARLKESDKSVLYVSHDRELLAQTAD